MAFTLEKFFESVDEAFADNVAGGIDAAGLRARIKDLGLLLDEGVKDKADLINGLLADNQLPLTRFNELYSRLPLFVAVFASGEDEDQSLLIQQAITQAAKSNRTVAFEDGKTYRVDSTLTINLNKLKTQGRGVIDVSRVTSGPAAVVLTGTAGASPYEQTSNGLGELRIMGGGGGSSVNRNVVGVLFDSPAEAGTSHMLIRNLNVHHFGIGIQFKRNVYCVGFENLDVYACDVCIDLVQIANANAGERITFTNCTIFNSALAIRSNMLDCDVQFDKCSFDYNQKHFEIVGTKVWVTGCHIEGNNYANYPITVTGDGACLYISNSLILGTGHAVMPPAFINAWDMNGKVQLRDNFVHNVHHSGDTFKVGNARGEMTGTSLLGVAEGWKAFSYETNLLLDGRFAESSLLDILVVSGTDPRTSLTSARNSVLSLSTDHARSGTQCLKHTKEFGGGSESVFYLLVPVTPGLLASLSYYSKKPGSSGGTVFHTYYWLQGVSFDSTGLPSWKKQIQVGGITQNLDSAPQTTHQRFYTGNNRVPANVNWLKVEINANNWVSIGESMYYDDFLVNCN